MKTLIVYASKYDTTKKCAKEINARLHQKADIIELKNSSQKIEDYDVVLIGGAIYADNIHKEVKEFIKNNETKLLNKKVGIFLCFSSETNADKYFKNALGTKLFNHAIIKSHVGYAYNYEKMGFMTKIIIKKMTKVNKSIEKINYDKITEIAKKINSLN